MQRILTTGVKTSSDCMSNLCDIIIQFLYFLKATLIVEFLSNVNMETNILHRPKVKFLNEVEPIFDLKLYDK